MSKDVDSQEWEPPIRAMNVEENSPKLVPVQGRNESMGYKKVNKYIKNRAEDKN